MGSKRHLSNRRPTPEALADLFAKSGIPLTSNQTQTLWAYHGLLREHTRTLNLTRIHNFDNMVLKLYVDSALPARWVNLPSPLMDLGSGPGLPGIILKILNPQLDMVLAETRQKRVEFLETVVSALGLENIRVQGGSISRQFQDPMAGVICRAVAPIPEILERIGGCLVRGGNAIFMKGPGCDEEIDETHRRFKSEYHLIEDRAYALPEIGHDRRLVVYERRSDPPRVLVNRARQRHGQHRIDSAQNSAFKGLKKLLTSRGIKKQGQALIFGERTVREALTRHPERCREWVGVESQPPPESAPAMTWQCLGPELFRELDVFGTRHPLLLVDLPAIPPWQFDPASTDRCTVLLPFQDPENVGAAVRSAAALGADRVVLLAGCAHPFHPKAVRASAGAVLSVPFGAGPTLADLPTDLPVVPLSAEGQDISTFTFPDRFAILPGVEGPGLPDAWRKRAVAIPMTGPVESLNAAVALSIALFAAQRLNPLG